MQGESERVLDAERFIDLGDQVLVLSHFDARGRDGIEVRLSLAHLWTLRNGQVVRMDAFRDHHTALEAGGLTA